MHIWRTTAFNLCLGWDCRDGGVSWARNSWCAV